MRWPLVLLAVPALLLGLVGLRAAWLPQWLDVDESLRPGGATSVLSVLLAGAGVAGVAVSWRRARAGDPSARLGRVRPALQHAFYVDELYDRIAVRPVRAAASSVGWADAEVVSASVLGSGRSAGRVAALLQRTQRGNVQTYLTGLLAGVVLLAVGVVTLT
jgi:NADH-quinone oxidoreductase subunit L